jgi:hypothetical protein
MESQPLLALRRVLQNQVLSGPENANQVAEKISNENTLARILPECAQGKQSRKSSILRIVRFMANDRSLNLWRDPVRAPQK